MKRFAILLMAIAWMLAGGRAMAQEFPNMAPVITNMSSPIVGGVQTISQPRAFVFPDAIDLNAYVSDDSTTVTDLRWSYEIVGSPNYLINGIPPINSTIDDPTSPTLDQTINKTDLSHEIGADAAPNTITIRNQHYAPVDGPPLAPPAKTGITDIQPVTFYCSDSTTRSSKTVIFYTNTGSSNYLSAGCGWCKNTGTVFTTWNHSWKIAEPGGPFGNCTTCTTDLGGLCFNVATSGDNYASVASPSYAPYITLTANTVYRFRIRMNGSQLTPGKTPFWDFIIENWPAGNAVGMNLYGMDTFFFDNEGGANSVLQSTGGTWINMYWAPCPVQASATDWSTLFSNPAYAARKDARVRFRVMDIDSVPALQASSKFGRICLQEIVVEAFPLSSFIKQASEVDITHFVPASNTPPGGNVLASGLLSSYSVDFSGGALTLTPTGESTRNDIASVVPANDLNPWTTMADDWPIAWKSSSLYMLQADLSAPDAASEAHPWDVMWMDMEPPTNEVISESYVTSNLGLASPKAGTPATYTFFYWSNNKTVSPVPEFASLRWRIRFGNAATLNFPNGEATNTGGVKVHRIRVDRLNIPN